MKTRLRLAFALALICAGPNTAAQAADVLRVSDGPFISGGAYYIAREKGYFKKLGIDIQHRQRGCLRCAHLGMVVLWRDLD